MEALGVRVVKLDPIQFLRLKLFDQALGGLHERCSDLELAGEAELLQFLGGARIALGGLEL